MAITTKHYTFQHSCGHTGIGPLIRISTSPDRASPNSAGPSTTLSTPRSIELPIPIPCPFCGSTQSYLNVAPGGGLLCVLEVAPPSATSLSPLSSTSSISTPITNPENSFYYEWRVLRVCRADEIVSEDWYLAHVGGGFRQMAWIPKPCGELRIVSVSVDGERTRSGVCCKWRQSMGGEEAVRSRLPGMWSSLRASLRGGGDGGEGR